MFMWLSYICTYKHNNKSFFCLEMVKDYIQFLGKVGNFSASTSTNQNFCKFQLNPESLLYLLLYSLDEITISCNLNLCASLSLSLLHVPNLLDKVEKVQRIITQNAFVIQLTKNEEPSNMKQHIYFVVACIYQQ